MPSGDRSAEPVAASTPPIFTIGHSTRTIDEFVALLRVGEVAEVVDIRSVPRSRTNPQYNLDALPAELERWQIAHTQIAELGGRSIDALAHWLDGRRYVMGDTLTAVDATAFAVLASVATPFFDTPLRAAVAAHPHLTGYLDRMMRHFYPDERPVEMPAGR